MDHLKKSQTQKKPIRRFTWTTSYVSAVLTLSAGLPSLANAQENTEIITQQIPLDGHLVHLSCTKNPNYPQEQAEYLKYRESYPELLKQYRAKEETLDQELLTIEGTLQKLHEDCAQRDEDYREKHREFRSTSEQLRQINEQFLALDQYSQFKFQTWSNLIGRMEQDLVNNGDISCSPGVSRLHLSYMRELIPSEKTIQAHLRLTHLAREKLGISDEVFLKTHQETANKLSRVSQQVQSSWADYCSLTPMFSFGRRVDHHVPIFRGRLKVLQIELARAIQPSVDLIKHAQQVGSVAVDEYQKKESALKSELKKRDDERNFFCRSTYRGYTDRIRAISDAREKVWKARRFPPALPVEPQSLFCTVTQVTPNSSHDVGTTQDPAAPGEEAENAPLTEQTQ